jgi:hypothetical protein
VRPSAVAAIAILLSLPSIVFAQTSARDVPHGGSIEIGGGMIWSGGYSTGNAPANLTRNPSTGSSPLTLFQTDGQLGGTIGADVRLGVYLSPRWAVEGGFQFTKPELSVRTSQDFESAPATTITERISQYLIEGSVLYHFAPLASGRGGPFVSGGGGYLRELDSGNASLQTGNEIHGGGGFKYWFSSGANRAGLRIEGRVSSRTSTVDFESDNKRRIVPTILADFAYLF